MTAPCALLSREQISLVLQWHVERGVARDYHLPLGSGSLCSFEGRDGSVVVTVAPGGSGVPKSESMAGLSVDGDDRDVDVLGMAAELGPSSIVIHHHGDDVGISVQSLVAPVTDPRSLTALAKYVVTCLRRFDRIAMFGR